MSDVNASTQDPSNVPNTADVVVMARVLNRLAQRFASAPSSETVIELRTTAKALGAMMTRVDWRAWDVDAGPQIVDALEMATAAIELAIAVHEHSPFFPLPKEVLS